MQPIKLTGRFKSDNDDYGWEHQSTEIPDQLERLEAIQKLGYNVVNCGHCGDVLIVSTTEEVHTIKCQGCGGVGSHCDFPDYVY